MKARSDEEKDMCHGRKALFIAALLLGGCGAAENVESKKITDITGQHLFEVTVRYTDQVTPEVVDYLLTNLAILRMPESVKGWEEAEWWRGQVDVLDPGRAQATVRLRPLAPEAVSPDFVWIWPRGFNPARPGVIEVDQRVMDDALSGHIDQHEQGLMNVKPVIEEGGDDSSSSSACCTSTGLNSKHTAGWWWAGIKLTLGRKEVCALININDCGSKLFRYLPFPYNVLAVATVEVEKYRIKKNMGCYGAVLKIFALTGTLYSVSERGDPCTKCGDISTLSGVCSAVSFF